MDRSTSDSPDLFQIYINDHNHNLDGAGPILKRNVQSLKDCYPLSRYHLLGNEDLLSILSAHFDEDVVSTYKQITPYAFKADFARYCLLYLWGGLYSDLDLFHINPLGLSHDEELLFFRDLGFKSGAPWSVSQALLLATPKRPEFKCAIEMVVAHGRERYYGANPLDPTGPLMFGRALARCNDPRTYAMGEVRALSVDFPQQNACFLTRQGEIAALRSKKIDGDISHLGLTGTNNYGDLWHNGQIWGEVDGWRHHGVRTMRKGVGATVEGATIRVHSGHDGCRVYGPYCALDSGPYRATMSMSEVAGRHYLDICASVGARALARTDWIEAADAERGSQIAFELGTHTDQIEFRLFSDNSFAGVFLGLDIEPL